MIVTPPDYLIPWLTHVDFLTKKLHDLTGDARLNVLNQRWTVSSWWDKHVLNIDSVEVLHREILMTSAIEPCWYARLILPLTTYEADVALFDRLKHESLGVLIFQGTKIKRASLVNYAINPQTIEYHWLTEAMHQHASELWLRLSEFKLNDTHSFHLVEILLPGLVRAIR